MNETDQVAGRVFSDRLRNHLEDCEEVYSEIASSRMFKPPESPISVLSNLIRDVQADIEEVFAHRISTHMQNVGLTMVAAAPTYGVYAPEVNSSGDRFWWAGSQRVSIAISSHLGIAAPALLRMKLGGVPDGSPRTVEIRHRSNSEWCRLDAEQATYEGEWAIELPARGEEFIDLLIDGPPCKLESDPRKFFMSIGNLSVRLVEDAE